MRTVTLLTALSAITLGQQTTRTLQFRHLQTPPQFAEAATVIRSIGEIRNLRIDAAQRTVTLTGDAAQASLADWLFPKLDRSAGSEPGADLRQLQHRPAQTDDDVIRVFYFQNCALQSNTQSIATVIRSLTEIRRAFLSNAANAFVVRGTQEQIDITAWLVDAFDKPSFVAQTNQHDITDPVGENMIRLFVVPKFARKKN
jgi:hypothetical protein